MDNNLDLGRPKQTVLRTFRRAAPTQRNASHAPDTGTVYACCCLDNRLSLDKRVPDKSFHPNRRS